MRFGPTFRSGRMRPADGPSNGSATLSRIRSLADYTIAMLESSFRKRQRMLAKNSEQMTAKEKYMRTDMNLEQKNGVAATTQDVLTHHLTCFGEMADYTAESRFFTPDGLLRGSEAIRRFVVRCFEKFAKPGRSFE